MRILWEKKQMIRVYLDNCCYNRPYDDQESLPIRLESEAKMMIQSKIRDKELELVWSYILDYENDANPDEEIRTRISEWKELAVQIQLGTDTIISNSKDFLKLGFSEFDSIHIACAIESKSDCFITTDKGILKKRRQISKVRIINSPYAFGCRWGVFGGEPTGGFKGSALAGLEAG